jgi:hypothetical protein
MGAVLACITTNLCECAVCMSCSLCSSVVSATLGQAVRFGYLLLFVAVMSFAAIMGGSYQSNLVSFGSTKTSLDGGLGFVSVSNSLNLDNLMTDCDSNAIDDCVYNQVIYRASFVLTIFFLSMSILGRFSETIHKGLWSLKIMIIFGSFIGMWWGENSFYSSYAEIARILSFFWLFIQRYENERRKRKRCVLRVITIQLLFL